MGFANLSRSSGFVQMGAVLILGDEGGSPCPRPLTGSQQYAQGQGCVTGALLTLEEAPSSLLYKSFSVGTEVLGLVQGHGMGTGC